MLNSDTKAESTCEFGGNGKAGRTADLSHIDTWLFDLDNTLYAADAMLMRVVELRIHGYIQRKLGINPDEAWRLQKEYLHRHGTTLTGLMEHHGVDAEEYLAFVNDVDVGSLAADPELRASLARLPGRRFVFTNNCERYARRVLRQLGLESVFQDVWDLRVTGFIPKPAYPAYRQVLVLGNILPRRCAMFDDLADNLSVPYALGMTTVWLSASESTLPVHVHHRTEDLAAFLGSIKVAARA